MVAQQLLETTTASLALTTEAVSPVLFHTFGADIALGVGDERVAGWVAVAPPLQFGPAPPPAEGDSRPVLVLAAEHDQFTSPDHLRDATDSWPQATVIEGTDHFLAGAAGRVAEGVLQWLRDQV